MRKGRSVINAALILPVQIISFATQWAEILRFVASSPKVVIHEIAWLNGLRLRSQLNAMRLNWELRTGDCALNNRLRKARNLLVLNKRRADRLLSITAEFAINRPHVVSASNYRIPAAFAGSRMNIPAQAELTNIVSTLSALCHGQTVHLILRSRRRMLLKHVSTKVK